MSNNFYNVTGTPSHGAQLQSAPMRAELAAIQSGFDKLPTMTGNGNKTVRVNSGGTALEVSKVVITEPATSATMTIADGKTLTTNNTLTLTGTDGSSVAFGTGGTVLYLGGALGNPSSGTVTNLTGTASININGTVGATTPTTGAFTTVTASSTIKCATTIGVGNATPSGSGAGITFPATQSASTDANTLDDYEEGTFTPTLYGGTTAGTTSYTAQVGTYTKIGRVVNFHLFINVTSATGTGIMTIGGLPFSVATGVSRCFPIMIDSYNWSAGAYLIVYTGGGGTLNIYSCADDVPWSAQTIVNEAQQFIISGSYEV